MRFSVVCMPSIVGTLMNSVYQSAIAGTRGAACTAPKRVVDIDDVDDPIVGVELQGADLTAAGSGLAAERRHGDRARARMGLLQVLVVGT